MRVLCVAEKPSIAKAVAGILGGGRFTTRNSRINYIKNYDFNFDFGGVLGRCQVTMTAVTGHLTNQDFPPNFGWGKCLHFALFEAPLHTVYSDKKAQGIAENIANESRRCDRLMIWTDCDREGEHIGFEITEAARKANPRINVQTVLRAHFAHLDRSHILNAARNAKELQMGLVEAVQARQELDFRSGCAFTRFLTDLLAKRISTMSVVSYGSCQFPTLGFVVDRYKRVRSFVSEKFWYIGLTTVHSRVKTDFSWTRPHIFDRLSAMVLYSNCMESQPNNMVKVIAKTEKPTSNYKPLPLTTVELQKQASKSFKMSAKDTLKAAEELYNKGFISYPRTETDRFPAAMDLKKLIEVQYDHPAWGSYARDLVQNNKFHQPRSGKHNDEAHPPIHPIKYNSGERLDQKEKKIYELVVRHFLACCSNDAKGSQSTVTVQWGDETFTASALEVKERNYLDVYPYRNWKTSAKKIPNFEVGQQIKISKTELKEGKTSPPNYMTESELIALMDANGIGTDATIADHIEKIKSRQYITSVKDGSMSVLVPSEVGMALVQGFENIDFNDNLSLTKPFLRRNLEVDLNQICEKKKTRAQVVNEINHMYMEAYMLTAQNKQNLVRSYEETQRENAENE